MTSGEADSAAPISRTSTPRGEDAVAPELAAVEERDSGVSMGNCGSLKCSFLGHSRRKKLGWGGVEKHRVL